MINEITACDAIDLICGNLLGSGIDRRVYEYRLDPTKVVKIEDDHGDERWQNVIEWNVWQSVRYTDLAMMFAGCHYISPNGIFLIQDRTESVPKEMYPKKMPAFFTDFKYGNFGWLNGQLVCHDYGLNLLLEVGMTKRLKVAGWWE